MSAEAREMWRTMTGEQYMAYLESLIEAPSTVEAAPTLKVVSAREFIRGRPPTAEEQAEDDRIDTALAAKWAGEDAEDEARERITKMHGEKAARAFDSFRVIEAAEFANEADSEPVWQVRGLIPRTGIGYRTGPSGTLKSFSELDLSASITRGVSFHGCQVTKGRAVIVCAEGSRGYKKRLRAYARHHGVPLENLPAVIPAAPNLFEPTQITALIARLKLLGATYVSLDSKWRMSSGADENSASDQVVVIGSMDRIARELGCFVMAVAHTGRDVGKGARGSTSQYAAVDVEVTQERAGEYCTLRVSKQKDDEDSAAFTFKAMRVELGFNRHGEPESSLVLEPVDDAAQNPAGSERPKGKQETELFDILNTMAPTGTVDRDELLNAFEVKLKARGGKPRKGNLERVLQQLIGKRLAFTHGEDSVSLTSAVIRDNDPVSWLE